MPIRPENKLRYPPDWKTRIVPSILARADNRCENCGLVRHALGARLGGTFLPAIGTPKPGEVALCSDGTRTAQLKVFRVRLTVAHLNHIPEDCRPENLRAWCEQCHIRYDAPMKALSARRRKMTALLLS